MTIDILREMIEKDGAVNHITASIRKCSELQEELTKATRGELDTDCLAEKMAEAQITLWLLSCVFDIGGLMQEWVTRKLDGRQL